MDKAVARRWVRYFAYGLAVVFTGFGVWAAVIEYRFQRGALNAEARVVSHDTLQHRDKWGRPEQLPVDILEFTTAAGQTVRIPEVGARGDKHRVLGARVDLLYHADSPEAARTPFGMVVPCLIAWGFAVLFFWIGKPERPKKAPANKRRRRA
jgi:hypothetical protein